MYQIAAQGIGFIGTALFLISFQFKDSKRLMLYQTLGSGMFTVHFIMLGAYTGGLSQAIAIVSCGLVYLRDRAWARWKGWKWLLSGLFFLTMVLTWQGPISLLPCVASVTTTMVNWTYNGKWIRLLRLCVISPSWMAHNIYTLSYSGVVAELFSFLSILISLLRYGLKGLDQAD